MIRASLDLWPEDQARYQQVRRQHRKDLRDGNERKDYERQPEVVYRCSICWNLVTMQPCLACRLKHGIPLPEDMQKGGGK